MRTPSTRKSLRLLAGILLAATAAQAQLTNDSLSPSSGSSSAGAAQIFTAVYGDGAGATEFAYNYFIVGASGSATASSCYMIWSSPGGGFYMMNDAGSAWLGPLYAGSGSTMQNSQCTVYGNGSSMNLSGNQGTMTVKLSFTAAYAGAKGVYMSSYGTQGDSSALQQMGTWTINGSGSPAPDMTITKSSSGSFTAGGTGTYTITASNSGTAATTGTVTVTDPMPGGLTVNAMSGSGWSCPSPPTCTRSDSLAVGGSYPAITVTVNVSSSASGSVTNTATVSGGGETNTSNDTASATVTISGGGGGNTLAAMTSPTPGSTLSSSTVTFNWNTGSGVSQYWLYVGTTAGASDIYTANEGTSLSQQVTGLPVNGSTVYVRLWSDFSTGWQFVDYTYKAYGGSGTPVWTIAKSHTGSFTQGQTGTYTITASNSGTAATNGTVTITDTLPGGLTVNAMSGSGWSCPSPPTCTRNDSLAAGSSYPAITLTVNVTGSPGSVTNTATVSGGGANSSTAYDGTTIIGGCGTLATMVSPTPGSTLSGSTATFTWNPSCTATQYYLYLGQTQGGNNLYGQSQGTNLTSGPVSIPSSGTLWVRLWSLLSAGWQFNDYSYTIGGGGGGGCGSTATMTSPATNGSTLTSSSFTFTWCNAGAAQYYLYVGNGGVGSNNIFSNSTGTNLSQQVTGLPGSGTLNVRLWSLVGGSWLFNDYTYTMSVTSTVSITVTSSPSGLSLTIGSNTCTATPCTYQLTVGSSYTIAAATPQAGGTGTQYVWASWSDSGGQSHSITVSSAATYNANFMTQYYLTTGVTPPGTGTINPASGWYNSGAVVSVSATANAGSTFSNFTGALAGTASSGNVTMYAPEPVTANFDGEYNITATTNSVARKEYIRLGGRIVASIAVPAQTFTDGTFSTSTYAPYLDAADLMYADDHIAKGCSGPTQSMPNVPYLFCPERPLARNEMAVYIVRAWSFRMWGASEAFQANAPYNSVPYFGDVPATDLFFPYVQKLYELGITVGCNDGVHPPGSTFCPNDNVTNFQVAVFTIRGRAAADKNCTGPQTSPFLPAPAPPPGISCAQTPALAYSWDTTPTFSDLTLSTDPNSEFAWIQRSIKLGAISPYIPVPGCSTTAGTVCPDLAALRAQMAASVVRVVLGDRSF